MKDLQTKGTGNSRFLKTSLAEGITWEQALAMLRAGTFPVDFNGFNTEGIEALGTLMKKSTILTDELATALGLTQDDPTILDVFTKLKELVATAQSTANSAKTTANAALPKSGGTMTGNLVLKGDPTSNLMAATKQYVDNNRTPAELNVLTSSGTTVKAVKGSTTLTATAGSDGWAKLYPSEFGEWTVTAGSTSKTINIDAIAVFYLVMSDLGSLSWSQVAAISKMGLASTLFHIGDKKTLTVNGVSYTAVIIGFDHDTPVDTATYGRDKAGITWQLENCMATTYPMNSSNTNRGGWKSCVMRTSTMATLLNQLASDLKNSIVKVKKLSSAGNQSTSINTTEDSLFLLSEVEIFGSTSYAKAGEGSQYEYYQSGNSRVKTVNGSASHWWERSPYGSASANFCNVYGNGNADNNNASYSYGVAFGFCI